MKRALLMVASVLVLGAPAYAADPAIVDQTAQQLQSETTVINTSQGVPIPHPVDRLTKAQQKVLRDEQNHKLDLEYKTLPGKPNKVFHPIKRADLWIDYHADTWRKMKTRGLPAAQFGAIVVGMGFSIAGAL